MYARLCGRMFKRTAGHRGCLHPSAAADNQDHLMVTDWEIGDFHRLHEAFGLKMHIIRQGWIHQLVQMNMNFCRTLFQPAISK